MGWNRKAGEEGTSKEDKGENKEDEEDEGKQEEEDDEVEDEEQKTEGRMRKLSVAPPPPPKQVMRLPPTHTGHLDNNNTFRFQEGGECRRWDQLPECSKRH